MKCKNCSKDIGFFRFLGYNGLCNSCYNKEQKKRQKEIEEQEKIFRAEGIINGNSMDYGFDQDIEREKYCFYKSDFENTELEVSNQEGYYFSFEKEEIINSLIRNKFNLKKAVDSLIKKAKKEGKESEIKWKMAKLKEAEERRIIREEAEKRLYGKVKTKRQVFSKKEQDMILKKFGNKCAVCGKEEGLHIHHKDGNPKNNRMDNLIVLCGVCHKKIHMKVR